MGEGGSREGGRRAGGAARRSERGGRAAAGGDRGQAGARARGRRGEDQPRGREPYGGAGEHVYGKVDAEIDAGEDDEKTGHHQERGEGRVDHGKRQGPRGGRGGVARREGARGRGLSEGGYLRVPRKGPGALEEVLGAFSDGPGARDGGPGDEEAR